MTLRNLLVVLIVGATAAFVIATSIERSAGESGHHEAAANVRPVAPAGPVTGEAHSPAGGESAATHAKEGPVTPAGTAEKPHAELRPLGVNVESWPVVLLAALASLALAAGAWLRPSLAPLVGLVVVAMLVFAALDVGEVVHQSDIENTLLAVLAGAVAALHLTAAVVATALARRALRAHPPPPPAPGTLPA